jgi:hypothetical protein
MTRLSDHVQIRVDPKRVAFWKAAAAEEGTSMSEMIRTATDSYARARLMAGFGNSNDGFERISEVLPRALAEVGVNLNELLGGNNRPAA